jgi:hypothetical protein
LPLALGRTLDRLARGLGPEVVIEAVDAPDPETYHGHDGVRRWFNDAYSPWAAIHLEAEDIKESGQWTIAVIRAVAHVGRDAYERIRR